MTNMIPKTRACLLTASRVLTFVLLFCGLTSCRKFLDAKPDQSIATPSTIDDLEGILNGYGTMNARYPSAGEVASDDFYLSPADVNALIESQRSYYLWRKYANALADYSSPYQSVEYANVIMESLPKVSGGDMAARNGLMGNALFIRASCHFALAQLYAKPYNIETANTDPGIALRLTADVADKPVRFTVAENYASIIGDLRKALPLLPGSAAVKYRAGKPAVYGMMARIYLTMRDYRNAYFYADSALAGYNTLIDYNTLSASAALPFKQFNEEVIYDARTLSASAMTQARAKVDSTLYSSYSVSDLRKTVLYRANANSSYAFKGTYTGITGASLFTGIATDELFLIKAECAARNGDSGTALELLNKLLVNRWKKGTYIPVTSNDQKQLLGIILSERRKELPYRTLRWSDLRRFSFEAERSKTLIRNLSGTMYTLEPNSARYVFQIDQRAVDLSGLEQNP